LVMNGSSSSKTAQGTIHLVPGTTPPLLLERRGQPI
jgi:hypothetical protein